MELKPAPKHHLKILVLEDSEEDRNLLTRIIKKLNEDSHIISLSYDEAGTLKEGVEILESDKFDLVLLDLSLPDSVELEGLETIINYFGKEIPVIVLSGHKSEEIAVNSIRHGAQDFIEKSSITPDNLFRAILYAMERNRLTLELDQLRVVQANTIKLATLGEVSANIAHEINNPLSIILGHADKLKSKSREGLSIDEIEKSAEKILKTKERITKIIHGLKTYSREEQEGKMVAISIAQVIDETMEICEEKFRSRGVEIDISVEKDLSFLGQEVKFSQVVLNLMNNSYDAIKELDKKWIKIQVSEVDKQIQILVSDSGQTPDKPTCRKMFSSFFTTKGKDHGTGLGLSISKTIIEDFGGTIKILRDRENTTFQIILPILNSSQKSQSA